MSDSCLSELQKTVKCTLVLRNVTLEEIAAIRVFLDGYRSARA